MDKNYFRTSQYDARSFTTVEKNRICRIDEEKRSKKEIFIGDKIFARLIMGGRLVAEFVINSVGSVKDLLDEMRQKVTDLRGLAMLQIRNQSRGWAEERRIMFC